VRTLKILQVASGMPGWAGTEKYVLDISTELRDRGHRVDIACQTGSVLERRAAAKGISIVNASMRSAKDWGAFPRFLRLARGSYNVVHTHSYRDYVVPAAACRLAAVPVVVMTRHLPHSFRNRVTAFACGRVFYDRIIAISAFIRDRLIRDGVPPSRIALIHNGIESAPWQGRDTSRVRQELGIPESAFVVAGAGRIVPEKGFDYLVRATEVILERGVDVHCLIAGDGDKSQLEGVVSSSKVNGRVHLLGFRDDVPDIYAGSDVVAVPSVWDEPFGYSVVEAFAAGRPVVASRTGGMVELVTGESGYLVPPGRAGAIAEALLELVRDPNKLRRMGKSASVRAEDFTLERCVRGIESHYGQALDEKGHF